MRLRVVIGLAVAVFGLSGCPQPPNAKDIDPKAKLVAKVMTNGEHCELVNGPIGCEENAPSNPQNTMQGLGAIALGAVAIGVAADGNAAAGASLLQAAAPMIDQSSSQQVATDGQCTWNGRNYASRESVYFSSSAQSNDFWNNSGLSYGKTFAERGAPSLSQMNGKVMQTCQCGAGDDGGWGCV